MPAYLAKAAQTNLAQADREISNFNMIGRRQGYQRPPDPISSAVRTGTNILNFGGAPNVSFGSPLPSYTPPKEFKFDSFHTAFKASQPQEFHSSMSPQAMERMHAQYGWGGGMEG